MYSKIIKNQIFDMTKESKNDIHIHAVKSLASKRAAGIYVVYHNNNFGTNTRNRARPRAFTKL